MIAYSLQMAGNLFFLTNNGQCGQAYYPQAAVHYQLELALFLDYMLLHLYQTLEHAQGFS